MRKTLLLLIIASFWDLTAQAQEMHLIQFADKDLTIHGNPADFLSQKALARREKQGIELHFRDYPVTPSYLEEINATGARVVYQTKWLNGALVEATPAQVNEIKSLPFVLKEQPLEREKGGTRVDEHLESMLESIQETRQVQQFIDYGAGLTQASLLETPALHAAGFLGEGMTIAVIDAGFDQANQLQVFDSLMQSGRLKGTFDFPEANADVFGRKAGEATIDDSHGTKVLSTMAAYQNGVLVGLAPKANYWLLKSEVISTESPLEEVYWLVAAEFADSVGADIINSSLGYVDFDKAIYNHQYEEFDGDQILISQAADFAAATGMLVITSAGNEGNDPWNYLSAPADGDSVLAVGGVLSNGDYWTVSSPGPTADGRIKPNVVAQGASVAIANTSGGISKGNGTSYASPIMAGFAACIWQAYPSLSNMELISLLEQASDQALNPDNFKGYGIPTYSRFKAIADVITALDSYVLLKDVQAFPNPTENGLVQLNFPQKSLSEAYVIEVVDAQGKVLYETTAKPQGTNYQLQLPEAVQGMYFINIKAGNEQKALKLLRKQ